MIEGVLNIIWPWCGTIPREPREHTTKPGKTGNLIDIQALNDRMQTALNKLKCTPKGKVYNKYVPENILNQKYNIYPFPRTVGQNTKEKLKNIIL